MKIYFFGCWNQPGHYMVGPHGGFVHRTESQSIEYYGDHIHIDGSLAPRHFKDGTITWAGKHVKDRVRPTTGECSQGQCLVHHLDNGFTAMQWWDRTQGDTRGACNSTILLEGEHDFAACVAALREHFPTVVANLEKAGVELVEVPKHLVFWFQREEPK